MIDKIRYAVEAISEYDDLNKKYFKSLENIDKICHENTLLKEKIVLRDNRIKNLLSKIEVTESRRRKNASAIGGFVNRNHKLNKKIEEYEDLLKKSYINLEEARNIIISQNKEIQRLKRKPKLTIENLRKWDKSGKSPREEEIK